MTTMTDSRAVEVLAGVLSDHEAGKLSSDGVVQTLRTQIARLRKPAEAQGDGETDPRLTVAARNLRSYLSKASFSSAVDKRAAENCVEVLVAAATAPPSAPVVVEARVSALQSTRDRLMAALSPKFGDAFDGDFDVMLEAINTMKRFRTATLAQQPAADGGFTAADMMDARQEGRKEAQRPTVEYADDDALIAHLDSLCDEGDEKWQPAQAAIAGILSWQATGSPVAAPQQPAAVDGAMSRDELDLCRQWFDSVQDTNGGYLSPPDYVLAAKLYRALGMRVPQSISRIAAQHGGSDNDR